MKYKVGVEVTFKHIFYGTLNADNFAQAERRAKRVYENIKSYDLNDFDLPEAEIIDIQEIK